MDLDQASLMTIKPSIHSAQPLMGGIPESMMSPNHLYTTEKISPHPSHLSTTQREKDDSYKTIDNELNDLVKQKNYSNFDISQLAMFDSQRNDKISISKKYQISENRMMCEDIKFVRNYNESIASDENNEELGNEQMNGNLDIKSEQYTVPIPTTNHSEI